MPCMCCLIFSGSYKQNSFLLGPIQPSSRTTKELHGKAKLAIVVAQLAEQSLLIQEIYGSKRQNFIINIFIDC